MSCSRSRSVFHRDTFPRTCLVAATLSAFRTIRATSNVRFIEQSTNLLQANVVEIRQGARSFQTRYLRRGVRNFLLMTLKGVNIGWFRFRSNADVFLWKGGGWWLDFVGNLDSFWKSLSSCIIVFVISWLFLSRDYVFATTNPISVGILLKLLIAVLCT